MIKIDNDLLKQNKEKEAKRNLKYKGKDYKLNGKTYKISFTIEDQNMLLAVEAGFRNGFFSSTNLNFHNKTEVPVGNVEDFNKLVKFWAPIRNSFF